MYQSAPASPHVTSSVIYQRRKWKQEKKIGGIIPIELLLTCVVVPHLLPSNPNPTTHMITSFSLSTDLSS